MSLRLTSNGVKAMAESKLKDENYYQIQGWMINRLGLKGITLSVYAIIYGFSQDGENEYTGSLQYLCDFTGGTSKPTIIKALKELVQKQYIIRREEVINNVLFTRYKANLPLLKNFNGGSKETLMEGVKEFNGGSKEILPNNKSNNKPLDKEKDIKNISDEFETLWKMYPRKLGKPKALNAYTKARKGGTTYGQIKQGLENYNKYIKVTKTQKEYIKHGSTWFGNECWNDEYDITGVDNNGTSPNGDTTDTTNQARYGVTL